MLRVLLWIVLTFLSFSMNVYGQNQNKQSSPDGGSGKDGDGLRLTSSIIMQEIETYGSLPFAFNFGQWFVDQLSDVEMNWHNRKPQIDPNFWTSVYSASDSYPSFILLKVLCEGDEYCGYVLINIDGTTPPVPQYDTADVPPISVADDLELQESVIYWLSPFDWFSVGVNKNGSITLKRSGYHIDTLDDFERGLTHYRMWVDTNSDTLINAEVEKTWLEALGFENIASVAVTSGQVPGSNISTSCNSPIPCYNQKTKVIGGQTCYQGCTPIAFSMIYGYWDWAKGKTNLISGSANTQTTAVDDMAWALYGYLGTTCSANGSSTYDDWFTLGNANKYPKAKGYSSSSLNVDMISSDNTHFNNCKTDIDSGIPCEVNFQNKQASPKWGHSIAIYGWTINGTSKYLKANTGWTSPKTTTYQIAPGSSSPFDIYSITKLIKVQ